MKTTETSAPNRTQFYQEPTHDEIALAAFLQWEREGRQPGREMEYWCQAEAQIRSARLKKAEAAAAEASLPWPRPSRTVQVKKGHHDCGAKANDGCDKKYGAEEQRGEDRGFEERRTEAGGPPHGLRRRREVFGKSAADFPLLVEEDRSGWRVGASRCDDLTAQPL